MNRRFLVLTGGLVIVCSGLLTGCGAASSGCVLGNSFSAAPFAASADHAAVAPGNQEHFQVSSAPYAISGNCAVPAHVVLVYAAWTNPDPVDIDISSANDMTNGLATCKGATAGAVTLTASTGSGTTAKTSSVQLTCK